MTILQNTIMKIICTYRLNYTTEPDSIANLSMHQSTHIPNIYCDIYDIPIIMAKLIKITGIITANNHILETIQTLLVYSNQTRQTRQNNPELWTNAHLQSQSLTAPFNNWETLNIVIFLHCFCTLSLAVLTYTWCLPALSIPYSVAIQTECFLYLYTYKIMETLFFSKQMLIHVTPVESSPQQYSSWLITLTLQPLAITCMANEVYFVNPFLC